MGAHARGTHHFDARAQGLLAEDVLVGLDGLDGLLRVDGGDGGDDDSLEAGMLEHLIVVVVNRGALEVGARPAAFLGVRAESRDDLSSGRPGVEVERVARAHAAEAGDGDLELSRHDGVSKARVSESRLERAVDGGGWKGARRYRGSA
jgi:hypothetical protein